MAHRVRNSAYNRLTERLNRFPQGAPDSPLLEKILEILMNEREAGLVAQLPIKPFTVAQASRAWKMDKAATRKILDGLAGRAILVDIEQEGEMCYVLPPPMAGFFEFSLMRIRKDINQKMLSELLYQYLNVEEEFIRELFTAGETQLGRVFIHEPALPEQWGNGLHVLDYERASKVIATARDIGVSLCYCRHKMAHVGTACSAPMEICMTFNISAASLIRHGHARRVEKMEGMELLHRAYENNLVQFGENAREGVNFICNCCGCCCEAMLAAKRFWLLQPVHTTNYLPKVAPGECSGCGKCVDICPVEAMTLVSANDPHKARKRRARLETERCLGCGMCVGACSEQCITLQSRKQRVLTPLNGVHRIVMMAIERGTLQHLIFDQRVMLSHRALAALLGVICRLPPVKQVLANKQIKSRYLERLLASRRGKRVLHAP